MSLRSSKKDHLVNQLEVLQQNLSELITLAKAPSPDFNHSYTEEVFNLTEELFFMLDNSGNVLNTNKASLRLLHYQRKELLGLNFVDLILTVEKKKCREYLSKLNLGFPSVSFQAQIANKNGEFFNLLFKALKKGDLVYILGAFSESNKGSQPFLSDRNQGAMPASTPFVNPERGKDSMDNIPHSHLDASAALTKAWPQSFTKDDQGKYPYTDNNNSGIEGGNLNAEHHLKAIINSSKQILFLIDKKMDVIAFNKHAEAVVAQHTGLNLKVGHNILSLLGKEGAKGLKEIYEDVLKGRSVHFTRGMSLTKKGKRWFEVNLFPVEDEDGPINNVVFSAEDITDRKLAEEKFRELEINFRSIFTQVAVGVVLSNLKNEIIQANKRFYELVEYSNEEFEEVRLLDITHPEDREKSIRYIEELIAGKIDHCSFEKRYVTKSGRIVWVYLTATIVKNRQGKPKNIISVAQDITLRKNAEQELLYKKNELDTFVYRASHDLRGPVASLMGLYNIVKVEFAHDKNAITYFEHYNNSVMRLHAVLQNLIDLTKIKESETKLAQVDIKDLIDSCLDTMKNLPDYHRIAFNVEVDVNFKVFIDSKRVKTIIKNLVENSIIYATPENTAFVKIMVTYQENVLKIEVIDNGRGIDPRIQSKVFNMFFRGTEKSKGSGLGLYIVKNAVEKLNGSIQVSSTLHEGTKFSVYIPYLYGQEYSELLEKNFVN